MGSICDHISCVHKNSLQIEMNERITVCRWCRKVLEGGPDKILVGHEDCVEKIKQYEEWAANRLNNGAPPYLIRRERRKVKGPIHPLYLPPNTK